MPNFPLQLGSKVLQKKSTSKLLYSLCIITNTSTNYVDLFAIPNQTHTQPYMIMTTTN